MLSNYEEFSEQQRQVLARYVTNTDKSIFVLRNLPEVIKGALFSRYSRSRLGLRSLLLKEFIGNEEEAGFGAIAGATDIEDQSAQTDAIKKAQNFYDRILDGYGDDSIGELGGAHLAVENVSMLAAKVIEDRRIGGSPLEKSTRYIYFDQKVNDEFLYYREPILMTSAFRSAYLETCDMLFETYQKLIPPMTELMEKQFPKEEGVSKIAYSAALRAKVLDCLRGLLPASTMTNIGVFGNGRFFEALINQLQSSQLQELQGIGKLAYDELATVIPSFVRRAEIGHRHQQSFQDFMDVMRKDLAVLAHKAPRVPADKEAHVNLVSSDPDAVVKVAAGLLYPFTDQPLEALEQYCRSLPQEELERVLDAASVSRDNRRHKPPRGLERAEFTFDIVGDFGAYRDLQRHRILTQERQLLNCDLGYYIPDEIKDTAMQSDYVAAMDRAKEVFDAIRPELPEEAQYVVPMGYNIRWFFHVNLRSLQWMTELRSQPAGHPTYRHLAQEMAAQASQAFPEFERFFKFVDYEGYELGRLGQEERTAKKKEVSTVV